MTPAFMQTRIQILQNARNPFQARTMALQESRFYSNYLV
jgi:hypothetical protein